MSKKAVVKVIAVAVFIFAMLMIITPTRKIITDNINIGEGMMNNITYLALGLLIVAVIAIILNAKYGKWWEFQGYRQLLGGKKDRIHQVRENVEAAVEYLRAFGIEQYAYQNNGHKLHVKATRMSPSTADIQIAMFLLSTQPVKMVNTDMIHEIPEHDRHFVIVDRRSNDVIFYDPGINDTQTANEIFKSLYTEGIPIEMKKKPLERAMEEEMKRGFIRKVGSDIAGGGPPEQQEEGGEKGE